MPLRSIATLSISFGLVSIPVKLYSATESSAAIRFKLMGAGGARVRQQYVVDPPPAESAPVAAAAAPAEAEADADDEAPPPLPTRSASSSRVVDFPGSRAAAAAAPPPIEADPEPEAQAPAGPAVVSRADMVKGYEFEKDRFVLFAADELKALEAGSRQTIDIVSFIPERAVDPIYFDKAYFLAPDRKGGKPYSLLRRALLDSGRSALARWAFRSKEYVVQIRAVEGGLVLQQLLYADEVRSIEQLAIDPVEVGAAELALARRLVEQNAVDGYDPRAFVDEEKQRILAAIDAKVAGREIVSTGADEARPSAQVVDLIDALRASLRPAPAKPPAAAAAAADPGRKPVKRAGKPTPAESPRGRSKRHG